VIDIIDIIQAHVYTNKKQQQETTTYADADAENIINS
jgi:hypothetical protein